MNITEFQQQISAAGLPVVVDFWAPWCGPCRVTKPILEKLAREFADRVVFLPINADDSPEVAQRFKIMGIPTVLTLRGGQEVGRVVGAHNEAYYRVIFETLAAGQEVKVPMSPFDRTLRLGGGLLFVAIGVATGNWVAAGAGAILAFMGIYDRCPLWAALTRLLAGR